MRGLGKLSASLGLGAVLGLITFAPGSALAEGTAFEKLDRGVQGARQGTKAIEFEYKTAAKKSPSDKAIEFEYKPTDKPNPAGDKAIEFEYRTVDKPQPGADKAIEWTYRKGKKEAKRRQRKAIEFEYKNRG